MGTYNKCHNTEVESSVLSECYTKLAIWPVCCVMYWKPVSSTEKSVLDVAHVVMLFFQTVQLILTY